MAWRAGTNARTRVRATDVENSRPPRDESWRSKNDPSGVASPASPPSKNNPARSGALRALSQHYCRDATFKALFYTIIEIVSVALRIAVAAGQGRNMSPTLRDDSDLSACLATLKNVTSTNIDIDTSTFVSVVWFLAIWSLVSHSLNIIYRVRHLLDLRFLSQHGYGRRWNYKHAMDLDCLLAPDSANRFDEMKRDYRVTRDLRIYNFHLSALSFLVALICDFPWSAAMVFKINVSNMGLVEQLSLATAGVSFGSKVKNAWNLLHNWRQYIIAVTTAGKL